MCVFVSLEEFCLPTRHRKTRLQKNTSMSFRLHDLSELSFCKLENALSEPPV